MPFTVFLSWQSDRGSAEQDLIERALNEALERIVGDATVEPAVRQEGLAVDRDTKGVGGTPPIVETIFAKIDDAAIFVPDLTFVSTRASGRPAPNPNVLIEYGWALKSLTHRRIVTVMNSHYGKPSPDSMPFDMRHLKFPVEFDLPPRADAASERKVCDALSHSLEEQLRTIIASPGFVSPQQPEAPFPTQHALFRFRMEGPIGKTYAGLREEPRDIRLRDAPSYWINLRPVKDNGTRWTTAELKAMATSPTVSILPPAVYGSGVSVSWLRGDDGFGMYVPLDLDVPTSTTVYVFDTGEIWGIDAYHALVNDAIHLPIDGYVVALNQYRAFLNDKLGIAPPYHLNVGIDRIKDKKVWLPQRTGRMYLENPVGSCIANDVVHSAVISAEISSRTALRPFFQKILEKCGVENPDLIEDLFPTVEDQSS
jgi:hypothetical protein